MVQDEFIQCIVIILIKKEGNQIIGYIAFDMF